MKKITLLFAIGLFSWSCANSQKADMPAREKNIDYPEGVTAVSAIEQQLDNSLSRAVLAGGCFWCVEEVFERVRGVEEAVSGYAGPEAPRPTYELVCTGTTDYAEAVAVYYDQSKVSYEELLTAFFAGHDPTQVNRQGPDVGPQYRTAIFYQNEEEKKQAQAYIDQLNASGKYDAPIATPETADLLQSPADGVVLPAVSEPMSPLLTIPPLQMLGIVLAEQKVATGYQRPKSVPH